MKYEFAGDRTFRCAHHRRHLQVLEKGRGGEEYRTDEESEIAVVGTYQAGVAPRAKAAAIVRPVIRLAETASGSMEIDGEPATRKEYMAMLEAPKSTN